MPLCLCGLSRHSASESHDSTLKRNRAERVQIVNGISERGPCSRAGGWRREVLGQLRGGPCHVLHTDAAQRDTEFLLGTRQGGEHDLVEKFGAGMRLFVPL